MCRQIICVRFYKCFNTAYICAQKLSHTLHSRRTHIRWCITRNKSSINVEPAENVKDDANAVAAGTRRLRLRAQKCKTCLRLCFRMQIRFDTASRRYVRELADALTTTTTALWCRRMLCERARAEWLFNVRLPKWWTSCGAAG